MGFFNMENITLVNDVGCTISGDLSTKDINALLKVGWHIETKAKGELYGE